MNKNIFAERLAKALSIRNMKPVELANKSGIDKAAISQYLKGKFKAKQDNVYILAKALDVNEAWLMGFDAPIKRIPDHLRIDDNIFQYSAIDSAMLPLLDVNDIAYIHRQETFEDGETILFTLEQIEYIRKVLILDNNIEFHAMNPYYPVLKYSNEELKKKNFRVIGKVLKVENKSAFK